MSAVPDGTLPYYPFPRTYVLGYVCAALRACSIRATALSPSVVRLLPQSPDSAGRAPGESTS
jgi:hypothetical protein